MRNFWWHDYKNVVDTMNLAITLTAKEDYHEALGCIERAQAKLGAIKQQLYQSIEEENKEES